MSTGGIARRLIRLAALLGRPLPGSLAHSNILANMLFGAVSGSAVAAAASVGGVMTPEMRKAGYDMKFGAAVNIASCTTGLLIPPSGTFILYSLISGGTSVAALFVAGYAPGILLGLSLMVVATIMARRAGIRGGGFPSLREVALETVSDNPLLTLLFINVALLIFTPIFLPVAQGMGIDPVHFGVIMTLNLCVGICTPPVGSALFVGASIADVPVWSVLRPLLPFYGAFVVVLGIVTLVPQVSQFLPRVLLGYGL